MNSTDNQGWSRLTRRKLFAGATAGLVGVAAERAAAQGCPTPPRAKGPLVWLDLDQKELDDAYDQRVYAFNQENISERRLANNQKVLAIIGKPERVAYGAAGIEGIDVYRTKRPNAPIHMFIHGGAWRGGRSSQVAYMAEPFIKAGAHFLSVDFSNVIETGGDLFPMVDQLRRAVAWVHKNAPSFGGNPDEIYLSGHSSGGHLGGCVVITDWAKYNLPGNVLKGALLGSGMYDLKPVRMSKRADYVKFTDDMEQALSPQRHLDKINTPVVLTYGTLETPEFQRQSRDFFAALQAANKPAKLLEGKGYNHFETQETLGNPYGFMGRAAMEMIRLGST